MRSLFPGADEVTVSRVDDGCRLVGSINHHREPVIVVFPSTIPENQDFRKRRGIYALRTNLHGPRQERSLLGRHGQTKEDQQEAKQEALAHKEDVDTKKGLIQAQADDYTG